jgi:glycosyltransferase involved in cell wall biosynthesis
MRIGIELRQLVPGAGGGLTPFITGLLGAAFAARPRDDFVLFCTDVNEDLFLPAPSNVHFLRPPPAAFFPVLDACAAQLRLDVLFRSYPLDVELAFPADRQVVLIPDIQQEFFPEFFSAEALRERRASFARALRESGAVATLSEHARQTLLDHPAARCEVFVTSPALPASPVGAAAEDLTDAERALVPAGDFFFYPANLWPHKNHRRVLQAFQGFLQRTGRPFEFVFTGHPDGWQEMARDFPDLPVRHLGFVRRPLLQELMRRATALAFFSLFEGFGIPLLEAFDAGTPVVCSNTTSLPEVGRDAVLSCDPTDVDAMTAALARVAAEPSLRAALAERGRGRLAAYRWEDAAARFLAVCERVAAEAQAPCPSLAACERLIRTMHEWEARAAAPPALAPAWTPEAEPTLALCRRLARRLARRLLGPAWRTARAAARWAARTAAPRRRAA